MQKHKLDENKTKVIWDAFGAYISKNLAQGRGILVPKLGSFTFSAPNVDLAGTTN